MADSFLAAFPASQAVAGWRGDGREVRSWGRPRQPRGPLEEVGAQLADLVELLHDLAGEVDEVARSLLEAAAPEAFASFRLELGPLAPGRSLGADLWLHNTSPWPVGPLRVAPPRLAAPDGRPLRAHVEVHPRHVAVLPAGASQRLGLAVLVHPDAAPGTYGGEVRTSLEGVGLWVEATVVGDGRG